MWRCKEWWNHQLTVVILCRLLSQSSLPPGRHQPHLLISSTQTINQKKTKNSEMTSNSQKIILYCFGLCTKNPVLTEVDLEPSPKNLVDQQTLRYFCIKQYVSACIESGKIFSSWDFFLKSFLFWKVFEWHQTIQEYGIYKWKIAK